MDFRRCGHGLAPSEINVLPVPHSATTIPVRAFLPAFGKSHDRDGLCRKGLSQETPRSAVKLDRRIDAVPGIAEEFALPRNWRELSYSHKSWTVLAWQVLWERDSFVLHSL